MFKKIIIFALRPLFKNYVYTVGNGIAKGLMRKGGLGFIPQISPLTQEEKFFLALDLNGQVIYDIGGYEGIFTLFFAQAAGKNGRVITFEPNPDNYNKIIENVKLNRFNNVEVWQMGVGKKRDKTTLVFHPSGPGSGSAQEDIKSQVLKRKGAKAIRVEIDSLDNLITTNNLPKPNFIKIDVEGLETDVLLGMVETIKKYNPKLYIEIHGVDMQKKIENVQKVVEFLITRGYSIYHVESEEIITSSNAQIAKEGHLYCVQQM